MSGLLAADAGGGLPTVSRAGVGLVEGLQHDGGFVERKVWAPGRPC